MIKKISLMIALVAIITSVSFGQIKFGVKGGLNLANASMSSSGITIDNKMLTGFEIGGFVNYSINDKLSIQPELMFAQYGCKIDKIIFGKQVDWKMNYISIPIMVKYNLGAIGILAGPQLGYLVSSTIDGEDAMDGLKKIDGGIAIGASYELEMGLGFDARYYLGLANLNDDDSFDVTMKNRSIQLAVYYKFK